MFFSTYLFPSPFLFGCLPLYISDANLRFACELKVVFLLKVSLPSKFANKRSFCLLFARQHVSLDFFQDLFCFLSMYKFLTAENEKEQLIQVYLQRKVNSRRTSVGIVR